MWDFQTALDETIKDKYGSQYIQVVVNMPGMKNYWLDRKALKVKVIRFAPEQIVYLEINNRG